VKAYLIVQFLFSILHQHNEAVEAHLQLLAVHPLAFQVINFQFILSPKKKTLCSRTNLLRCRQFLDLIESRIAAALKSLQIV
jgi:hypothetical protein